MKLPDQKPVLRKEVLLSKVDSLFGDTLIPQPGYVRVLVPLVVLMIVGLAGLMFGGEYARRERVAGWLQVEPRIARVTSPKAGIVKELLVAEGARVRKGQPLLVVETRRSSTAAADIDEQSLAKLKAERETIVRRKELERSLAQRELEQLRIQTAAQERNVAGLERLCDVSAERLALAKAEHDRALALVAKGVVASVTADRAKDALLAAQLTLRENEQRLLEQRGMMESRRAEEQQLDLRLQRSLAELNAQLSGLEQRSLEVEGMRDTVVHASMDGQVIDLIADRGGSLSAGATLMSIMPATYRLQARLLVPSRAIGFVREGMEVRLTYDAFPYEKFGHYRGVVADVGMSTVSTQEIAAPVQLLEPAYVVKVDLDSAAILAYGRELPLRAGLTLKADLMQERRRVIEWILDPIYALRQHL